jgi:hypothetical protein
MTQTKTFPGMACTSTEFFQHEKELKIIQNGTIKNFAESSFCTIQILKEEIEKNEAIKAALNELHPDSEMKRIEQFVLCRFGGLDFQPDIKDGIVQDGEYWPCPKRGQCSFEGTLCKLPKINGHRLNDLEILLMQKTSTDLTNDVIAEEASIPLGTFHKVKKELYEKLSIKTKQELVKVAIFFNIIQL